MYYYNIIYTLQRNTCVTYHCIISFSIHAYEQKKCLVWKGFREIKSWYLSWHAFHFQREKLSFQIAVDCCQHKFLCCLVICQAIRVSNKRRCRVTTYYPQSSRLSSFYQKPCWLEWEIPETTLKEPASVLIKLTWLPISVRRHLWTLTLWNGPGCQTLQALEMPVQVWHFHGKR